jgi:hypothetical protein
MDYKMKSFWLIICVSVGIVGWLAAASFGNVINSPYSAESDGNIGAWYDEVWDALGYYRLERVPGPVPPGGSETFRYNYTTVPTTPTPPVFRQGQASILQDMTVTEWRVSGHVHFSGGM